MRTHVALVRGINVGGNNLVKMADLRQFLVDIGLKDPATLLQSGNMVFTCESSCTDLEGLLETESQKRLGLSASYMVRTVEEWDKLIAANPFPEEAEKDPSHLVVVFSKKAPEAHVIEAVQAACVGPEVLRIAHGHLFVYYPEGIGESKLMKAPGWNKSGALGTGRNWNTVLKLAALARD
ncbi:MAG TPA: DUF1697 domain-containing protein [Fimbriimonas sp.]|nr:DUF1697 domain-containing protein [Fimbriimonas sp.]